MKTYIKQFLVSRIFNHYPDPIKNTSCLEYEVDKWNISEFVVNKLVPIVGIRPFPLSELELLTSIVCLTRPDFIFDWGTHIGKSARIFYEISNSFGLKISIHSTDLPESVDHCEHPHKKRGVMVKGIKNVRLHLGDGVTESLKIAKRNKRKKYLFFLDGDHSYGSVKRELLEIYKFSSRSTIVIHDTFYQSTESGYNVGPYKAITEFIKNKHYYLISTQLGLPGMTVLLPHL